MGNLWFVTLVLLVRVRNSAGNNEEIQLYSKGVTPWSNTGHQPYSTSRVKRSVCGGDVRSSPGRITSPNYPLDYPANINCTWNIIALPTERIFLSFSSFTLENCCDHVVVYTEKDSAISRKHGPFRGTDYPGIITTDANSLFVNFYTDGSVQKSGFNALYRKERCGGEYTSSTGTINSPEFPEKYPHEKRCLYEIVAPSQHCINLNFTLFKLEDQSECTYDSVQINSTRHDGSVHQYGRACGNRAPNNITCEGKYLRLEFKSDGSVSYPGFTAVYRMVYAECSVNKAGCKHICQSNAEGKHTCACHAGYVLHPDGHDCKEESSTGKIVQLTSLTHPNGSLIFSWKWRNGLVPSELTGFYFEGTSPNHTFLITLPPSLTNVTFDQLRVYTEYDVTLWPFFKQEDDASSEKLGTPLKLSVRTPASAPSAPTAVTPWPESNLAEPGVRVLAIYAPMEWNSKPVGYRLRWKPRDSGDQKELVVKFSEFSGIAARRIYDLNVTVTLKPGHGYTVFASACGLGDAGETLVGPETSVALGTTPLAPVNLSAAIVDPASTLLTWQCLSPAQTYEVTLIRGNFSRGDNPEEALFTTPFNLQAPSSMEIWTMDSNIRNVTILLDGSRLNSSSHSLPVFGLVPYKDYEVHIRACAANSCSGDVSTTFSTSPSLIYTPSILTLSSDTTSIYLEWRFPHHEQWLRLGLLFQVRTYDKKFFRLITTAETALTITNLTSGTEYTIELRPFLEVAPDKQKYGYPARAVVSTWPLVPLAPTLSAKRFKTALTVLALSWSFSNSTILHVEVSTNSSDFVNCEDLPSCDVVRLQSSNASFKAGFLKISGLNPYEAYAVDLRGCNEHGCGNSTRVHLPAGVSEASAPLLLQLSAINNATAHLCWQQPAETGGKVTGYLVSWKCENGFTTAATTTDWCVTAANLPTDPQECIFSVSAYNVADDGEELYGKPTTLTTQWPQGYTATTDPAPADSSR
ncbi:uncharacterized protein LOC144138912 [Haemaphysalis longicornis]